MKINLGKILLIILIFANINLNASEYSWSASINKKTAFVNEAIYLNYVCEFNDKSELYTIDFNPVGKYEQYDLILLSEDEKIINNKRINNYEFVAFVKKSGKVNFNFDALMKKTTQDSIDNTVLGRDNVEKEEFSTKVIRQKTLSIDIEDVSSKLVGEFEIKVKKDKTSVKSFAPFHMEVIIKGDGNFQALKPLEFSIEGVKVFSQIPIQKTVLTKNGYSGIWSQKFAFVSEKDFIIPETEIEYINPKNNLEKKFKIDSTKVLVTEAYQKEQLLDTQETKFKFSYEYLYYVLTFIAGFLVSKIKFKKQEKNVTEDRSFKEKIKNAKSLDELLVILVLQDTRKYENIIKKIELDKSLSIREVKNTIINY